MLHKRSSCAELVAIIKFSWFSLSLMFGVVGAFRHDRVLRTVRVQREYRLRMYNEEHQKGHLIKVAVKLFYDLITIHPFENGNERLRRLVIVYVLMRLGFPFPFSFSHCDSNFVTTIFLWSDQSSSKLLDKCF